jgi:hypothetical protein
MNATSITQLTVKEELEFFRSVGFTGTYFLFQPLQAVNWGAVPSAVFVSAFTASRHAVLPPPHSPGVGPQCYSLLISVTTWSSTKAAKVCPTYTLSKLQNQFRWADAKYAEHRWPPPNHNLKILYQEQIPTCFHLFTARCQNPLRRSAALSRFKNLLISPWRRLQPPNPRRTHLVECTTRIIE